MTKTVSKLGEEGKVAIRNVRRDAMKAIEKLEKDGSIGGGWPRVHLCWWFLGSFCPPLGSCTSTCTRLTGAGVAGCLSRSGGLRAASSTCLAASWPTNPCCRGPAQGSGGRRAEADRLVRQGGGCAHQEQERRVDQGVGSTRQPSSAATGWAHDLHTCFLPSISFAPFCQTYALECSLLIQNCVSQFHLQLLVPFDALRLSSEHACL